MGRDGDRINVTLYTFGSCGGDQYLSFMTGIATYDENRQVAECVVWRIVV
jgi:hypothetical protein